MIAGKKFYSRRVFAVHGLLLGAVLISSYLSVRAQYEALRDQQLQEAQTDQQLTTRVAAITLQNQFQLLLNALGDVETERDLRQAVPAGWLKAITVIERGDSKAVPVGPQPTDFPRADNSAAAAFLMADVGAGPAYGTTKDGKLVVVAPVRGGLHAALAVLSTEQIAIDMQALTQRAGTAAASAPAAVLTNDNGMILAGPLAAPTGAWIQSLIAPSLVKKLNGMIGSGNAGSELLPDAGSSLISVQPFTPMPGMRWRVISVRSDLNAAVSLTLRPLFWQLLSQAALMLVAGAVVLGSTTVSLLRGRRRIETLRMDILNRDLQKARRIQLNWLPAPQFDGQHVTIAAENKPALHISGDFYNWFELPRGEDDRSHKTVVVIGDVSGHGLPAAFLMATTQLLVRNTMPRLRDPGACLAEINRQLCTLVYNGQFVTMMILVIDHDNAGLEIASAGHHAPLRRRDGEVECLPIDPQLVVGVDDSVEYQTQRFRTRPGDTFLLFTDGAIEMTNPAGEQFRIERLHQAFAAACDAPRELVADINRTLETFRGETDAEDDLTILAAQVVQADVGAITDTDQTFAASI